MPLLLLLLAHADGACPAADNAVNEMQTTKLAT
jgi:hypothetical protein